MKKPFFVAVLSLVLWPAAVSSSSPARVALTFDDGPRPTPTYRLKHILWRYRVPATFFVVGKMAVQHPEVLQALARDGHEICNHSWSHADFRFLSPQQIRRELDQTRLLIQSITGQKTFYFRTPGLTEEYIRKKFRVPAGYELVLWNVHSLDQEGGTAEEIADRVIDNVKDGDVVLLHNGLQTTMEALDIIIPELKERGFEFVTVNDLLQNKRKSVFLAQRPNSIRGQVWVR